MKLVKLVKLVKLISVYFFDIFTSKKAQNPQFFTLLTSKCASRHNGVHFFDTFSTSEPPKVVRDRQFLTFWLRNVLRATTACTFSTSQLPKVVRAGVFCTFWLGNVLRATTACTFSTSQLPKVVRPEVFCTFWLGNVLRATTACTFSTSQLPKVVRDPWCVLYILTSKCASRHNGVQFFISHLASWLRTRRFSEPTFRPSGATNHWKNTVFRDFPTFSRICIFFLLTLSLLIFSLLIFLFSLPLPCSAFHLSILSEVWLLIQTGLTARRGDRVELLSCSHVRASTWFGGVAEKLRVRNPKLKDKKRWTFDARNVSFGENNLMISVHVFDACPILWTFGCCKFVLSTSNNQDF